MSRPPIVDMADPIAITLANMFKRFPATMFVTRELNPGIKPEVLTLHDMPRRTHCRKCGTELEIAYKGDLGLFGPKHWIVSCRDCWCQIECWSQSYKTGEVHTDAWRPEYAEVESVAQAPQQASLF